MLRTLCTTVKTRTMNSSPGTALFDGTKRKFVEDENSIAGHHDLRDR